MSPIPRISVIIPTYNRLDALQKTLQALETQTLPATDFEVILVDDGSTEDLAGMISDLNLNFKVKLLTQSHRGPASARNKGIK